MSLFLRILLIVASLCTTGYMIKRIRQAKVQIEDTIFWIVFSVLLTILSIFPVIADWLSQLLGVYSTVNFIFLFVIFILLIRLFIATVKISQMDSKIRELAQKIAIDENINLTHQENTDSEQEDSSDF